jgi:phosphomannomutase
MKKVLAFDLDGTLAPSKTPLTDRMADVFGRALQSFHLCVISGCKFEQFEKQIINNLHVEKELLGRLHLMPTCGTSYYAYDTLDNKWKKVYAEDLTEAEKKKISDALTKGVDDLGYREKEVYGETVEDRGSQVTYSILGQDIADVLGMEGVARKEAWDPDNKKKDALREYIAPLIPEFEVRVGGLTSIDVTKPGIDKAYGMRKLTEVLGIGKEDILFFGDRMTEGGNDYPVKAMGVDSVEVGRWEDTALALETILHLIG